MASVCEAVAEESEREREAKKLMETSYKKKMSNEGFITGDRRARLGPCMNNSITAYHHRDTGSQSSDTLVLAPPFIALRLSKPKVAHHCRRCTVQFMI